MASNSTPHNLCLGFNERRYASSSRIIVTPNMGSIMISVPMRMSILRTRRRTMLYEFSSPISTLHQRVQKSIKRSTSTTALQVHACSSVETAASLFTFATAMVIPVYTLMILAPRHRWTKQLVQSDLPHVVMGVIYLYLLAASWTPEHLQLMFASKNYLPELAGITRMFSSSITVASAWVHLLAMDLFVGRQIYLDGLKNDVETRHSLVLCLMVCPIGLLSHLLTKLVKLRLWKQDSSSTSAIDP